VPVAALEERAVKTPAPPGATHVVLDAEQASRVVEVLRAGEAGQHGQLDTRIHGETRVVCERTPCVADLTAGDHDLRFLGDKQAGDFQPGARVYATIGRQPTEFRATLSKREVERTTGYDVGKVLSIVGFLVMAGGLVAWGTTDSLALDSNPYAVPSIIVGASGLAMLAVGTILELGGRGLYRPGSFMQWNLAAQR
jgi:hypothetical protein